MTVTTRGRGRILRDTSTGDGLVYVDGKQYPFGLGNIWKSEIPPKINAVIPDLQSM